MVWGRNILHLFQGQLKKVPCQLCK